MIGRFSIYVLIKFEIRLRLKVIYSNLLALNGTFRTVATQTPSFTGYFALGVSFAISTPSNLIQLVNEIPVIGKGL
jgi:hypothetical protein